MLRGRSNVDLQSDAAQLSSFTSPAPTSSTQALSSSHHAPQAAPPAPSRPHAGHACQQVRVPVGRPAVLMCTGAGITSTFANKFSKGHESCTVHQSYQVPRSPAIKVPVFCQIVCNQRCKAAVFEGLVHQLAAPTDAQRAIHRPTASGVTDSKDDVAVHLLVMVQAHSSTK